MIRIWFSYVLYESNNNRDNNSLSFTTAISITFPFIPAAVHGLLSRKKFCFLARRYTSALTYLHCGFNKNCKNKMSVLFSIEKKHQNLSLKLICFFIDYYNFWIFFLRKTRFLVAGILTFKLDIPHKLCFVCPYLYVESKSVLLLYSLTALGNFANMSCCSYWYDLHSSQCAIKIYKQRNNYI